MKGARLFVLLALAIACFVALDPPAIAARTAAPPPASPHQLNARVSMTVDAGLNSYVKERAWIPLRVTLNNTGDPIEGEVIVTDGRLGIAQRFSQPVSLVRGARRLVPLYVPSASDAFEVQLVNNDGVIASVTPVVRQLAPTDRLVLIASDPPDGFNFIGDVRTASGSTSALALLRLDQFPDHTAALDAADVVVLNGVDTGTMTRAQRDAVVQWVAAGGHLILSGGPNAQLVLGGFTDVAPARTGQALVNTPADELGTLASPASIAASAPVPTATLTVPRLQPAAPDARTLAGSAETPLIMRRDYGRGFIDQLAFDPALAPLRDWPGRAELFTALMNGRVNQANDVGTVGDGLDARFAAGALTAASPPSALVVGGFFLLYVTIIGPLNFLLLRRLRKQALAWITIPAIVIGFTLLGVLTGFRLRGNNPQMHRLSVTLGDASGERARAWSVYGLYSPRRADVEVRVNRALAQVIDAPPDAEQAQPMVDIRVGDPTRISDMPLSNSEVRTVYARDGATLGALSAKLAFVPGSANTAAAIAGEVRNDTGQPLQGCTLVVGKDYQSIGNLSNGGTAQVKLNLVVGHPQSLLNLRSINNVRERYASGRTFSYSNTARTSRPTSSSGAAAAANNTRYPFEQNGPAVTDALVNWQSLTDPLLQDAEFGMVATAFGSEGIGPGAYVACWEMRDTNGAQIDNADYTDRALRVWRVPIEGHLAGAGESLPPDVFTWNVISTNASSELGDNGLSLEPGSHIIALTPWFDLRIGPQTPLVALNMSFNTSNSSLAGLRETSVSLYDWREKQYVQVVDAADDIVTQNTVAGPFVSPAGQIMMRIDARSESVTLYRVAPSVEMGK